MDQKEVLLSLKDLVRLENIHNNPVEADFVDNPSDWFFYFEVFS